MRGGITGAYDYSYQSNNCAAFRREKIETGKLMIVYLRLPADFIGVKINNVEANWFYFLCLGYFLTESLHNSFL